MINQNLLATTLLRGRLTELPGNVPPPDVLVAGGQGRRRGMGPVMSLYKELL